MLSFVPTFVSFRFVACMLKLVESRHLLARSSERNEKLEGSHRQEVCAQRAARVEFHVGSSSPSSLDSLNAPRRVNSWLQLLNLSLLPPAHLPPRSAVLMSAGSIATLLRALVLLALVVSVLAGADFYKVLGGT